MDDGNQSMFSPKLGHLFEKKEGRPPPLPSQVMRLENKNMISFKI